MRIKVYICQQYEMHSPQIQSKLLLPIRHLSEAAQQVCRKIVNKNMVKAIRTFIYKNAWEELES